MRAAASLAKISAIQALSLAAAAPHTALAQTASELPPAFCPSLQSVTGLAIGNDRFGSITGKQREGSYSDTTLSPPGRSDCLLYAASGALT